MATAAFIIGIFSFFEALITLFKWLPWKLSKADASFIIDAYNGQTEGSGKNAPYLYDATAICNGARSHIVLSSAKPDGEGPYIIGNTYAGKSKGENGNRRFMTEYDIKSLIRKALYSFLTCVGAIALGVVIVAIAG